ncbi:MAG: phosphate transport system permease protein [Pseudohongiellaceae bacterium]|jgi:phosphate transport system permease protein
MTSFKPRANKHRTQPTERLLDTRHRRHYYDLFASKLIAFSGIGVIVTISLIFVYLLYEILPLFKSATVNQLSEYRIPELEETTPLHWALNERGLSALRLSSAGSALLLNTLTGDVLNTLPLPIAAGRTVTAFALDNDESGIFALGLDDGSIVVAQYSWQADVSGQSNSPLATAKIVSLFEAPVQADSLSAVAGLAIRFVGNAYLIAASHSNQEFQLLQLEVPIVAPSQNENESSAPTRVTLAKAVNTSIDTPGQLFIDGDGRFLIQVSDVGMASLFDIKGTFTAQSLELVNQVNLRGGESQITSIHFLVGELSLLVATDSGAIAQWFVVRGADGAELVQVREFELADVAIVSTASEQRRKNFAATDSAGNLALYNTTANTRVFNQALFAAQPKALVISPRGTRLLAELENNSISYWSVDNPHPEVSFSALWNRVWYESYPQPDYIWQSSSASNDFEPKFSLVPLTFGTLKAAFYAMLFASPLAICAAIYTGYFMAPALRRSVKPLIELMEALPTVVLGFLAGLWLAPFVESNLLGILSLLIFMPLGIGICSFLWFIAPKQIRLWLSDGWEAILLIPVIIAIVSISLALGSPLESAFFDGSLQGWLNQQYGISYNERNAMIVGFAMGFAVIPTIYSIAEDAIFSVPRHLSDGSLALGATAWQSLFYVVLPMASPGIFSAVMIGLGRAVGETMIVLMATGNTPVIDFSLFEGMRTLAANIAVEVPESEVGSSHYRILFLAAMCLFLFTFIVNTLAEIVRQRLRRKYINL